MTWVATFRITDICPSIRVSLATCILNTAMAFMKQESHASDNDASTNQMQSVWVLPTHPTNTAIAVINAQGNSTLTNAQEMVIFVPTPGTKHTFPSTLTCNTPAATTSSNAPCPPSPHAFAHPDVAPLHLTSADHCLPSPQQLDPAWGTQLYLLSRYVDVPSSHHDLPLHHSLAVAEARTRSHFQPDASNNSTLPPAPAATSPALSHFD